MYLPFRFNASDGPGKGSGSGGCVTGPEGGLKDEHVESLVLQPEVCQHKSHAHRIGSENVDQLLQLGLICKKKMKQKNRNRWMAMGANPRRETDGERGRENTHTMEKGKKNTHAQ